MFKYDVDVARIHETWLSENAAAEFRVEAIQCTTVTEYCQCHEVTQIMARGGVAILVQHRLYADRAMASDS